MSHHSITLKKTEESRLHQLYQTKCDENGSMDITQFIQFAIERSMISNKFGIEIFYTAFKQACGEDYDSQGNYGLLDTGKFFYAITLLSKVLCHGETDPFEAMFSNMLVDKLMTSDQQLMGGRLPKSDAKTNSAMMEIFSGDAIRMNLAYLPQLKSLFTQYIHQNQNDGKNVVSWKDIEEKNIVMVARSFLKMCRYKQLIPSLLPIESLQECMEQTLPPITNGEHEFYLKERLRKAYDEDYQATRVEPMVDASGELTEPALKFHEFLFLLGLIAWEHIRSSETIADRIQDFYVQRLGFGKRSEAAANRDLSYEEVLQRIYRAEQGGATLRHLEDGDSADQSVDEEVDYDEEEISEEEESSQKQIMDLIERKQAQERLITIDWEYILGTLDKEGELPLIPERPMVEQINPPGTGLPRMLFGDKKLMEKPEDDGKKKKKAAKKAAKKDEAPPKPIKWADPPRRVKDTLQYMQEARADLAASVFPLNLKQSQANTGIAPCIIKEVYFPPECPSEVATLIESAIVYQNSSNFEMAVDCFEKAKAEWVLDVKNTEQKVLMKEQELFFELSIAGVYDSAGKDDLALNQYMKARDIRLVSHHPDLAFAYCGLGSVMYHMEEPAWALRLYLKARKIREDTIGGDTVDTATVYNNLGCCMYMLERNEEAKAYFELASAILECELGPDHERTLTANQNTKKINRTDLDHVPEYRRLWTTVLHHPCPKAKKKKKGKKGKKKK